MGNKWQFVDNYAHHDNGRIWLMWLDTMVSVKVLQMGDQYIHAEVNSLDQKIKYTTTIVYAFNQLEKRKILWNTIENLGTNLRTPWIVMGDFNNVINSQGRIGGTLITTTEYRDLTEMMHRAGLFEAKTRGSHYTWSNKHRIGLIYSRIDHLVGNAEWFMTFNEALVDVLLPHISDHASLRISLEQHMPQRKFHFKFLNCITMDPSHTQVIQDSWQYSVHGTAMCRLWSKLKSLQNALKPLTRKVTDIQMQIQKARHHLTQAQEQLNQNLFDETLRGQVKICYDQVLHLNQVEEDMLIQKSKVTWLKLGDNNNSYFHAAVKEKNKQKGISTLHALDGRILTTQDQIEDEILDFYKQLVGTNTENLKSIDLNAIRRGKILSRDQAQKLITPIEDKEI
ncbi:uncharacterized protein LOC131606042 [Vicia villosa]|uniref:uncharacterized protein LOC131606042 n=1 Tax=Vicia villosa TaxID=3911 RepID=UPI00273CCC26|nr:uncharacterized protein LOC131606042 [Vicia villosa]